MFDYHIHTQNSSDASYPAAEMLDAAERVGLSEICFTDHVDRDDPLFSDCDMAAQKKEIDALRSNKVIVKRGVETGLCNKATSDDAWNHVKDYDLDFIIGSIHLVNGENTYYAKYFDHRTQEEGYIAYLETIEKAIKSCSYFSILGHYDFVAKYAPFSDRTMRYSYSPSLFDSIFRHLVETGKSLEINTSAWRDGKSWGLDILKRYVELGGEYVTFGSDSHTPDKVGNRIHEAEELAKAAGIKYVATFAKLKPTMHKL